MPTEILEQVEEGFCALDRELKITYANTGTERIWQRKREELIGQRLTDALGALVTRCALRSPAALGDGDSRRIEYTVAPAGLVEIGIHPNPAGLWLHLRDQSAWHSLEQQLRERDEVLTMVERSAGIGVWDIDLSMEMVRGTPQFFSTMRPPPTAEAVPIEVTRQLRLPEDRERVAQGFRAVVGNHANAFEMVYRIRSPDGEVRWIFGRGRVIL